jgi:predicted dehydrogenase
LEKIRVSVVGVGHLGFHHARVLKEIEDAHLVGVYDIDRKRREEVAEHWNCKSFSSLEELLDEVDAVSCVVPTREHYRVGKKILEAGKHLFLEKPMATTLEEAEELLKIAKDKGVKFQIGHIERFNPAVIAVRDIIKNPKFVESHRLAPYNPRGTDVDVILDLMIHDLDLILTYVKSKPISVHAVGIPVLTDKIDIANVRIEFEEGEIANVTASRVSVEKMRKIRMFQKDTYISIDYLRKEVEVYIKRDDVILPYFPLVNKDKEPLKLELEGFIEAIKEDKEPPVTAEEGFRALSLALWVKEGIKDRLQKVRLD